MRERAKPQPLFRFGLYELDPREARLSLAGRVLKLQQKPLEVLTLLVERPSVLVRREELQQLLWPDATVDFEHGLNTAVNKLRVALDDRAENPRFIETVPRRGYRFIAPVTRIDSPEPGGNDVGSPAPESRAAPSRAWKSLGLILIVAAIVVAAARVGWWRSNEPVGDDDRPMLAVLPFQDLSGDPDQEYFSDGLTEELILHLSRLNPQRLGVIARTSTLRYKKSDMGIDRIAQELNADYILEGSVRRRQNRLRITAQLIQTDNQSHLWAESYDRDLQDWFSVQRGVAERVARALDFQVFSTSTSGNAPGRPPLPEAYEAYLKGRYFRSQITDASFGKAVDYFKRAVALDGSFAAAYAGMASCHCLLSGHGLEVLPPTEAMPLAKEAALKALSLDESLAEAHAVLGMVRLKYEWDFEGARSSFRRALELEPNYAQAHLWHSMFLEAMGQQDEALRASKRARDLDPVSLATNANLGIQLLQSGHVAKAEEQFRKTLELNPEFWGAHWGLGRSRLMTGSYEEALEHLESAVRFSEGNSVSLATLGYAHAAAGKQGEATRILDKLAELGRRRYVSPAFVAYIHAALGDADAAFAQLEEALALRSRYLVWLGVAPEYDSLRTDPRFEDLLHRMGLPRTARSHRR